MSVIIITSILAAIVLICVKKDNARNGRLFDRQRWRPKEEAHKAAERQYWGDQLRYIRRSFCLSVFTFFVAIVAAICAGGAYFETKRQADSAQSAQRPWIAGPEITVDQKPNKILFRSVFKNVGHTASYGLDIKAIIKPDGPDWIRSVEFVCDEQRTEVRNNMGRFRKFSAPPEGQFPSYLQPTTLKDLQQIGASPQIIGCVLYGWKLDDVIHQTGFFAPIFIDESKVTVRDVYTIDAD